jgi:hypothetical protein
MPMEHGNKVELIAMNTKCHLIYGIFRLLSFSSSSSVHMAADDYISFYTQCMTLHVDYGWLEEC